MNSNMNNHMDFPSLRSQRGDNLPYDHNISSGHGQSTGVAQQCGHPQYGRMCDEPDSFVPPSLSYTESTILGTTPNNFSGVESSPTLSSGMSANGSGVFRSWPSNLFDEGFGQTSMNPVGYLIERASQPQQAQRRTVSLPQSQSPSNYYYVQALDGDQAPRRSASQPQPQRSNNWPTSLNSSEDIQHLRASQLQSQLLRQPISGLNSLSLTCVPAMTFGDVEMQASLYKNMPDVNEACRAAAPSSSARNSSPGFQCKECQTKFEPKSGRGNLLRHVRLHCRKNKAKRPEKPQCPKCDKKFSRPDNVRKHVKNRHTDGDAK